jgi:hypothetical protein
LKWVRKNPIGEMHLASGVGYVRARGLFRKMVFRSVCV